MASTAPKELLDWLVQCQFLTAAQADLLGPSMAQLADNHSLAKELIRRDWLTPYQVNQILQGRQDGLIVGTYRLRERLGEGAMGQVFKAWHPVLDRIVAIKMIHKGLIENDKAMERFRREVETAAQLDHPNIAHVRDAGEADGRPYLVMEYIEGINLSQRIKDQGPLSIHEAAEYARQAALGLQFAYERGIVHRDIKPANLIVTRQWGEPEVKILDFGLARLDHEGDAATRLTQVGKLLGTVDYIAPEQAQDARNADTRSDIYSLGCTLYYLLNGQPPFTGKDMVEKLGPRVTGEPPWVRTSRPDVPPGLEEVVRKMMARRPDDRYPTPIDVAQALQPFTHPPVPPGVVLALPVTGSEALTAGTIPVAQPILAMPVATSAEWPDAAPAFAGMSATGRAIESNPSAASIQPNQSLFPYTRWGLVIAGGMSVLSLAACIICIVTMWPGTTDKKTGTVRITAAKFSMPDNIAIPGKHHNVLVWIERVDFIGPVDVALKDLPDGVYSPVKTIPANDTKGEIRFTISFGTPPTSKEIRVVAECKENNARAETTLELTIGEDPRK